MVESAATDRGGVGTDVAADRSTAGDDGPGEPVLAIDVYKRIGNWPILTDKGT